MNRGPRDCTLDQRIFDEDVVLGIQKETIMKLQKVIATAAGLLLFGTAVFGQDVNTDFDRATDFAQYKTYSWERVQTQDPLWVDRIENAVNANLAAKGWTEVPSGGDVAVVAIEMTRNQQTVPLVNSDQLDKLELVAL